MKKAQYILKWLVDMGHNADASAEKFPGFKIYSLTKLVYELRRHADLSDGRLKFTSTSQVADKLCSGTFEYCPNMACTVS